MPTLDLSRAAARHAVELDVSLPPELRPLVENTWRGRMVNEHASARVFGQLVGQLMQAGLSAAHGAAVAEMVADELRHAEQCAGALLSIGARPVGDLPALPDVPAHPDAGSPLEVALRNVISVCCLSETVAVALIDAERRALEDNPLAAVLRRILGDEVRHARFGWKLLEAVDLDPDLRRGLDAYLPLALGHLEAHELAHLSPACPPEAARALGACDGRLAREIFYDTVERVILPGLERHGLAGRDAWAERQRISGELR